MPSEFELIERFVRHFPRRHRGLVLGPGDDAAILRPSPGCEICASADAVVEGVHFDHHFTPEDIGHKALAVNLSDLAAMGAVPRWFLAAVELPPGSRPSLLDGMGRGMANLAQAHRCALAGGNLSRGPAISVTITVLGELPAGTALRRDRLRPGDVIAVTGSLGAAALGLRELGKGRSRSAAARSQRRPTPRVVAGIIARSFARAAIDVSDGLAQDLGHVCEASGCGAELWTSRLPAHRKVRAHPDWRQLCLVGGEAYELLLGVPPHRWPLLRRRVEATGLPLAEIGRAVEGRGLRLADAPGGAARKLSPRGFHHF